MQPFTVSVLYYQTSSLHGSKMDENGVLDATVHCPNLLVSDFTTLLVENGGKWRFPAATAAETKRKDGSLGGAAIGWMVLYTMVEKKKHSYVLLISFSQSQSNFTT